MLDAKRIKEMANPIIEYIRDKGDANASLVVRVNLNSLGATMIESSFVTPDQNIEWNPLSSDIYKTYNRFMFGILGRIGQRLEVALRNNESGDCIAQLLHACIEAFEESRR